MRPTLIALFLLSITLLPGCVAWEIRDEVRIANGQICEANRQLADVQAGLTVTNAQLAEMYAALQRTDERLIAANTLLESAHPKLTTLDGDLTRMQVLDEVSVTLKDVQKQLVPLSKSLGVVSGAANLLGMGSGGNQDLLAAEPSEPASTEAAVPTKSTATTATSATPTSASTPPPLAPPPALPPERLEALVGTWLQVYPPPQPPQRMGKIIVLSTGGGYLEAQEGGPITLGHWTRTGRTITIGPDAAKETGELLAATPRSVTVRFGDALRVYTRP
jgi:hypothetical protein